MKKVVLKLIIDDSTEFQFTQNIKDKIELLTKEIQEATNKLDFTKGKKVVIDFLDGKYKD